MKSRLGNRSISSVVAASILLAAALTVAVTLRAFIIPEIDREQAFIHSQRVLQSLKELYSRGAATISLGYAGTPFFSVTTYPGQISMIPSISVVVKAYGVTILNEKEGMFDGNVVLDVQRLAEATLLLKNLSQNAEASILFISHEESVYIELRAERYACGSEIALMRIQLKITSGSGYATYNYTIFVGDSMEIPLSSRLFGLSNILSKATRVHYATNSSSCILFLKYTTKTIADVSYNAQGAIVYKLSNFPLSYMAAPWGLIALQGGDSALLIPARICWTKSNLMIDLYNITWSNIGTISGSQSIGIKFRAQNYVSIKSTIHKLELKFSYSSEIKDSILQLKTYLQNSAPEEVEFFFEEGYDWLMITVTGIDGLNIDMLIRNVEAVLE